VLFRSTLHPVGLLAVIFLGSAMILAPRRYALIPMIIMACFISPAQRLVVLTLDFHFLRLMIVAGLIRLLVRREIVPLRWRTLDTAIILWSLVGTTAYSFLMGSPAAAVTMLGFSFDAVGMYFLFRFLIRDWDDIALATKYFVCISVPVAMAFFWEKSTGRNVFSIFGGVPEFTDIREGKLRVQGAFAHPIIAGVFWAAMIPFAIALFWQRMKTRWLMLVACVSFATIIIATRAALRAVPPSIREAALGIGASDLQVVTHHVLPLAMPGILTGTIIGMAQALGETAPLLMIGMVAFIVDVPGAVTDPSTVLPVQIYIWADSPERAFVAKTSAAIMVLLGFLITMNAIAVLLRKRFERRW